jgi:hypothetical protein
MARPKKRNPVLDQARQYVEEHAPELQDAQLSIRSLEGPPGSPRFAATVEACTAQECPYGIAKEVADANECPVHECQLRHSLRILLDREGNVVKELRSGIHYVHPAPQAENE